ncbi:tetratricopeptide repeat protein [Nocardia sp. NPDC127526]|uniref:tetratricopeptide repeat protein n=1 Tax=Nocardia sp. NPDC127526 TaxID=3345393 RepID=UPI003641D6CD
MTVDIVIALIVLLFAAMIVAAIVRVIISRRRVRRFADLRAAGRYSEAAEVARSMISKLAFRDDFDWDDLQHEQFRASLFSWHLSLAYVLFEAGDYAESARHAAEAVDGRTRLLGALHPDTITARHFQTRVDSML